MIKPRYILIFRKGSLEPEGGWMVSLMEGGSYGYHVGLCLSFSAFHYRIMAMLQAQHALIDRTRA